MTLSALAGLTSPVPGTAGAVAYEFAQPAPDLRETDQPARRYEFITVN